MSDSLSIFYFNKGFSTGWNEGFVDGLLIFLLVFILSVSVAFIIWCFKKGK